MDFRGGYLGEDAGLITFFNQLKLHYPDLYDVAIHPDNGRLISGTGFNAQSRQKAKRTIRDSASDIIIVGSPTFVYGLKRQDHTKSKWQDGQLGFWNKPKKDAFVCVAFGYLSALNAVKDYILISTNRGELKKAP